MTSDGAGGRWHKSEYFEFVKDLVWTIFVFLLIALAALGLQTVTEYLDARGASAMIVRSLTFAEYAILVGDVIYLLISVGRHVVIFAIACWKQIVRATRDPSTSDESSLGAKSCSVTTARFADDRMWIELSDSRIIGLPIEWFPSLQAADDAVKSAFQVTSSGIYWPELNEEISIVSILAGQVQQ